MLQSDLYILFYYFSILTLKKTLVMCIDSFYSEILKITSIEILEKWANLHKMQKWFYHKEDSLKLLKSDRNSLGPRKQNITSSQLLVENVCPQVKTEGLNVLMSNSSIFHVYRYDCYRFWRNCF